MKKLVFILLSACLCVTALAGCGASDRSAGPAPADAASTETASNKTPTDGHEKILGIVADSALPSTQEEERALCEYCGLNFEDYTTWVWAESDKESAAGDAIGLILDQGCTTVIFAVKGSEQIADQFSLEHPDIQVVIADMTEFTDISEEPKKADIDWTEVSYTKTDSDGYTYEITFKLSPWILLSDTDIVTSAWAEVGGNNTIPGFNDWGLKPESSGNQFRQGISEGGTTNYFAHHMTDMYYCIGTVKIENITEGWNISASSPRSLYFSLRWASSFDKMDYAGAYSIGRVFYSNGTQDESDGLGHSAKMTSDQWGPTSFIIMAPENFTPNFPNGEHADDMLNGYFHYFANGEMSEKIHLGMFGKDGAYTPPISVE